LHPAPRGFARARRDRWDIFFILPNIAVALLPISHKDAVFIFLPFQQKDKKIKTSLSTLRLCLSNEIFVALISSGR
jgi:hypothetical protein